MRGRSTLRKSIRERCAVFNKTSVNKSSPASQHVAAVSASALAFEESVAVTQRKCNFEIAKATASTPPNTDSARCCAFGPSTSKRSLPETGGANMCSNAETASRNVVPPAVLCGSRGRLFWGAGGRFRGNKSCAFKLATPRRQNTATADKACENAASLGPPVEAILPCDSSPASLASPFENNGKTASTPKTAAHAFVCAKLVCIAASRPV
mmetsp:Transcript_19555/g.66103  ORF Transcript_19555/g.66103 Transcript_19555/m.66103 type:complete len:210 (-) Transcript_19555:881-1510(-)